MSSTSNFPAIRRALEDKVQSVFDSISGFTQVVYENVTYDPVVGQHWARVVIRPVSRQADTLGVDGKYLQSGIMTVDVFVPENIGPNAADVVADAILNAFNPKEIILVVGSTTVRLKTPYRNDGRSEGEWYFVPVTVEWYCYE